MTPAVYNIFLILLCLLCICIVMIVWLCIKKINHKKNHIDEHTFLCIYASQSGQTQAYALQTVQQLKKAKKSVLLMNIQDLKPIHLQHAKHVIWMVSSYIDGAAPDTAYRFNQWLFQHDIDLSQQNFAVLAFGDQRYTPFCGYGQRLFTRLIDLGATAWFDVVTVDHFSVQDLKQWNAGLATITHIPLTSIELQKDWQLMTLCSRTLLNTDAHANNVYEIVFNPPKDVLWQAGDSLEIQCCNIGEELTAFKRLYPDLTEDHLNDLVFKDLSHVPELLQDESIEQWIVQFEDLPTRIYSIANLPLQGKLHLHVYGRSAIKSHGRGTQLLTQKLKVGQNLLGHIRKNPTCALLATDVPVIFIANTEGLTDVTVHLKQRATNNQAQNWLIVHESDTRANDRVQQELLAWHKTGILPKLDKVNLQQAHLSTPIETMLMQNQDQLSTWIEQGAIIYVCGRLEGILSEVNNAFLAVLGERAVVQLKQQQRYVMNVY